MQEKTKSINKKSKEIFKKQFYSLEPDDYELLSNYVSSQEKVKVKHITCGFIYEVTPNRFLEGRRCPKCKGGVAYSHEDFLTKMNSLKKGKEYKLLDTYINNHTKIKFLHKKCDNVFLMRPRNFVMGDRCPYCSKRKKKNLEEYKEDVKKIRGKEFEVIGEYKNNKTKILIKHITCGLEKEYYPKDFLYKGVRCDCEKKSKGEIIISNYLNKNNIKFEYNYKENTCKYKRELIFDFKIYLNAKKFILLEFDGNLHFNVWKEGKKHEKHLEKQKTRDKIKDDWCKINNIKLIRINYKEINKIEEILAKKLNLK